MSGLQVIGAGFGRTGTLSLKEALEMVGFGPCYHMVEVFDNPEHIELWEAAAAGAAPWGAIFAGYGSAVDWPAAAFYEELMDAYPQAKVILTVRDPDRWYRSVQSTIAPFHRAGGDPDAPPWVEDQRRMSDTIIWNGVFHGQLEDRDEAIRIFQRNTADVLARVPAERLLLFDVREGWEPLCRFLRVPVPAAPFPHLNDTASFQAGRLRRSDGGETV